MIVKHLIEKFEKLQIVAWQTSELWYIKPHVKMTVLIDESQNWKS